MILKQIVPHTFSRILIASVVLILFTYSMPCTQTQTSGQPPLDPSKLIFEIVSGDYGNIYNVIQDKDGFLWLAGIDGAIKYDGYKSEKIYSGETVTALFQDSEGLIWMVIVSGVAVYYKKTAKTIKYIPSPNEPNALSGESYIAFQKTQLFAEDRDGFIWIATVNGLNKFDKKNAIGQEKGQPRYRLLIAEDQLENRILLHKILEPFDFDRRKTTNGKEAVELFEQWHPDLIWMGHPNACYGWIGSDPSDKVKRRWRTNKNHCYYRAGTGRG